LLEEDFLWRRRTISIGVWTGCFRIATLCSNICERAGRSVRVKFEVLLYDLTSTYFESDPPFPKGDKRRYGYSRDKRSIACKVS